MFRYSPVATFFFVFYVIVGALFSIPPEVMKPYVQPIATFFWNLGLGGFYLSASCIILVYIVVVYNRRKVK